MTEDAHAANEIAVEAFLDERIVFGQIPVVIDRVLQRHDMTSARDLQTVIEADRWARVETEEACS